MTHGPARQVENNAKFVPLALPSFSSSASNANESNIEGLEPTRTEGAPNLKSHSHSASLEVDREGDRITRIRIRCACGELIVVDCVD